MAEDNKLGIELVYSSIGDENVAARIATLKALLTELEVHQSQISTAPAPGTTASNSLSNTITALKAELAGLASQGETVAGTAGKDLKAVAKDAEEAGASISSSTVVIRHLFGMMDSATRGARGAFFSSLGAMIRDSGLFAATLAAVGSAGLAAGAVIVSIGAALAYADVEAYKDSENIEGIVGRLNLFGNASAETASQVEAMQTRIGASFNLWRSQTRELVSTMATIPGVTLKEAQSLAVMAGTITEASRGQITIKESTKELAKAAEGGTDALQKWAEALGYAGEETDTRAQELDNVSAAMKRNEGAILAAKKAKDDYNLTAALASQGQIPTSMLEGLLGPPPTVPEIGATNTAEPYGTLPKDTLDDVNKINKSYREQSERQRDINVLLEREANIRARLAAVPLDTQAKADLQQTTRDIATIRALAPIHTQVQIEIHKEKLLELEQQLAKPHTIDVEVKIKKDIAAENAQFMGGASSTGIVNNQAATVVSTILQHQGEKLKKECAEIVNQALAAAGVQTSGSLLASSFLTYGKSVSASSVRSGDIFYAPPSEGATGHVGIVLGEVVNGLVKVMSSHMQGLPDRPAGVEWRNAANLQFRRPPYSDSGTAASTASAIQELANTKEIAAGEEKRFQLGQEQLHLQRQLATTSAQQVSSIRASADADERRAAIIAKEAGGPIQQSIQLQTDAASKRRQADDEAYSVYKENALDRIATIKETTAAETSAASASDSSKISTLTTAKNQITAIYADLVNQAKSQFHQLDTEWLRIQKDMTNAAKEFNAEINKATKQSSGDLIRDLQRERREIQINAQAGEIAIKQRTLQTKQGGDGGLLGGGFAAYQQEAKAAQTVTAENVAVMRQADETIKQLNSEYTAHKMTLDQYKDALLQVKEIQNQAANDNIQLAEKVRTAWQKLVEPVNKFFESLGSAFQTGMSGILKALIAPQIDIIHAGLTTIRTNERGTEIRQAIASMLLSAVDSAAKSVMSAAANAIGNMLLSSVSGATLSDKMTNLVMKLFGQTPAAVTGATAVTTAITTGAAASIAPITTAMSTAATAAIPAMSAAFSAAAAGGSGAGAGIGALIGAGGSGAGAGISALIDAGGFIFSRGGIVPSAAGGMIAGGIGGGILSILHPREMVLPAQISQGLQGMIASGMRPASGGSANLNYSPNINMGGGPMSRSEFASMLDAHASDMIGNLRNMIRSGWRG